MERRRGMEVGILVIAVVACLSSALAAENTPPSPFVISGWIYTSDGNPCNNPIVQITNINRSITWYAENSKTSNYYQLVTDSGNVSACDSLVFNVSGCGQSKTIEHTVTQDEMNNGSLTLSITLTEAQRPINISIRADGINGTIFNASYTVYPGTVTEDGITINNQTAMGALVAYCHDNKINVDITMESWGAYVIQIGDDPSDENTWMYAVDETIPGIGGDKYNLSGGEFVHWFNYKLHYYEVHATLNRTAIKSGDHINATVTWKNLTGTHPLSGASVYVSDASCTPGQFVGTTGPYGNCTFQWFSLGTWYVYAVHPVYGSGMCNYPPVYFTCEAATTFDTGEGTYPSISGTFEGEIIPSKNIKVNRIYTYPCAGTGGHIEYVKIWNDTTGDCAVAEWKGYLGDYHNLTFNKTITLKKDIVYHYIIRTGSYPQIIHSHSKELPEGTITCTRFRDANNCTHHNWIPAIRLYYSGAEESWAGFHTNAGFALSTTPDKPSLLWPPVHVNAVPSSSLIVVNDRIYVFCSDGKAGWVTCLDAKDGRVLWKSSPKGLWNYSSWLTPAYYNGKIYVPMGGKIYLMKNSGGIPECVRNGSVPAVALHEIDAETGKSRVHYYLAGSPKEDIGGVNGGALAAYGGIFFGTYKNGTYYRYNPSGGNIYEFTGEYACRIAGVSPKDVDFIAVEDPDSQYGWRYAGDDVSSWSSGEHVWSFKVREGAAMSTPAAAFGNVYLGAASWGGRRRSILR